MASNVLTNLTSVDGVTKFSAFGTSAQEAMTCPYCSVRVQMQVIATVAGTPQKYYRCPNCFKGAVRQDGVLYPGVRPFTEPLGLPTIDAAIWTEALNCLGVGAYSATVMLCRKLLFHIAVENGLPAKKDNDRAPTFYEAVEHLESAEIITKRMRPWVDRIKDVGNDANHELSPVSEEVAMDVATFTHQLLKLAYEFDAIMSNPTAGQVDP